MKRILLVLGLTGLAGLAHALPEPGANIGQPDERSADELQRVRCVVQGTIGMPVAGIAQPSGQFDPAEYVCNGTVQTVAYVPEAENVAITSNGRVFVSGAIRDQHQFYKRPNGPSVWETSRDEILAAAAAGGLVQMKPVPGPVCTSATGLALYEYTKRIDNVDVPHATLISVCGTEGQPARYSHFRLDVGAPDLAEGRVNLGSLSSANGAAVDAQGNLYVVNGPTAPPDQWGIVRAARGGSGLYAEAQPVTLPESSTQGPYRTVFPNGLDYNLADGLLYFSDGGGIARFDPDDPNRPVEAFYYRASHIDDISVAADGVYFADYFEGSYGKVGFDGFVVWETSAGTSYAGSHIVPMGSDANGNSLFLVTDKGILTRPEPETPGNALRLLTIHEVDGIQRMVSPPPPPLEFVDTPAGE